MAPPKRKPAQAQALTPKKPKPLSADDAKAFYLATMKAVSELVDDSGQVVIADSFRRLVNKKQYPHYYQIINNPISLFEIMKKIHKNEYAAPAEFVASFKLMLDNAALFNDIDSPIVDDATKIYNFVRQQCAQYTGDTLDVADLTLAKRSELLVRDVIDHQFDDLGVISGPFIEDVDANDYPDYFKLIKTPTSFNHVLRELETSIIKPNDSQDANLQRLYDAVKLIFDNAQLYNEPESLIYHDSVKLMDYFDNEFQKLKHDLNLTKKPIKKPKTPLPPPSRPVKLGRPRKKIEVEPEPESEEVVPEPENDPESPKIKPEPEETPIQPVLESNVMGKTDTLGSINEVFITTASVFSSLSNVSQIIANTQEINQASTTSKSQIIKDGLFPTHPLDNLATLFEYKFPANGYCTQAHTLVLPSDSWPQITLDFNLHLYLQGLERPNLSIAANDDFQCNLFVNDSTVDVEILDNFKLRYDIKLSYGLNVVLFECKASPNVTKVIKKSQAPKPEPEELGGRHTRHQLQQYKRSWEVEKITFYIVSSL